MATAFAQHGPIWMARATPLNNPWPGVARQRRARLTYLLRFLELTKPYCPRSAQTNRLNFDVNSLPQISDEASRCNFFVRRTGCSILDSKPILERRREWTANPLKKCKKEISPSSPSGFLPSYHCLKKTTDRMYETLTFWDHRWDILPSYNYNLAIVWSSLFTKKSKILDIRIQWRIE